jgi:hypothetical protein
MLRMKRTQIAHPHGPVCGLGHDMILPAGNEDEKNVPNLEIVTHVPVAWHLT